MYGLDNFKIMLGYKIPIYTESHRLMLDLFCNHKFKLNNQSINSYKGIQFSNKTASIALYDKNNFSNFLFKYDNKFKGFNLSFMTKIKNQDSIEKYKLQVDLTR